MSSLAGGGQGGNGSSGGGSAFSGPCGACKFLRRKCVAGCIFAPYFNQDQGSTHFAAVHRVFGASNVSKMLNHIPENKRFDAVITICYEALARLRDPIYGCISHIFALQQQIMNLQSELNYMRNHLAAMEQQLQVPFHAQPQMPGTGAFSFSDLLPPSNIQANIDLSFVFDEQNTQQLQQLHQQQYVSIAADTGSRGVGGSGIGDTSDLHALAMELLNMNGWVAGPEAPLPRTHQ